MKIKNTMNTIKTVFKPSVTLAAIAFCIFALTAMAGFIVWRRYCAIKDDAVNI